MDVGSLFLEQIVHIARHLRGPAWTTLSIARDRSDAWNEKMGFTPQ